MSSKKPKGVKTAYTCFVQACRQEYEKKHPNEKVNFAEFSKRCGDQWKELPEAKKQKFKEISEKDKKRYEKEMENYVPKDNVKQKDTGKKRKAKKEKDPNEPKRGLSAYFLFMKDERPNFVKNNPDTPVTQIAKELGQAWKECPPEVRKRYEDMAQKEKAKYTKAKAEYDKKNQNGHAHASHSSTGAKRPKMIPQQQQQQEEPESEEEEEDSEGEEEESDE